MPEIYLRQQGFAYSACGPFTKDKERIKIIKETRDSKYVYQDELDKPCFQHDLMKFYVIKHLMLLKIQNLMDINIDLLQWCIHILIKKLLMEQLKMKL